MHENPWNKMLQIMTQRGSVLNPPSIIFGEVIQSYPNLIVKTESIQINKDNLLVCNNSGYKGLLHGDKVLLQKTLDKQIYVLIDKVVNLP